LDPSFIDAYMNRGFTFSKLNQLDSARKDFTLVIGFNPQHYNAYKNRAITYYVEQNYQAALTDLGIMETLRPQSGYIDYNRFKIYQKMGLSDKANTSINKAIIKEPENAVFYNERGLFYNETGKYQLAEKDFNMMLSLGGNDGVALLNLGVSLRNQGDFEKAIQVFEKALLLQPDNEQLKRELAGTRSIMHIN